jgi:UrcA family protein
MSRLSAIRVRPSLLAFAALGATTCLYPPVSHYGAAAAETMSPSDSADIELVNYEDLDLGRKADQAKLKWRIHRAAIDVCEDRYLDLVCYEAALTDGWNQARRS